tara:strand:- start:5087 stop:6655 length:1569 start_codon:yes stop_codon:yes gene_type:complete
MNKFHKEFLKINKKILDNENKEIKILIVDRGRFFDSLIYSILGSAFCNKIKSNAIIISDKKNNTYKKIFKSFGFNNFFNTIYGYGISNFNIITKIIKSLICLIRDLLIIKINSLDWFIENYKIQNIPMGDLIYNTYVRYDHSYLKKKIDIKFVKILYSTIYKASLFFEIINRNDLKYIFASGSGYASNNGVLYRIASFKKMKIVKLEIVNGNRIGFKVVRNYFKFNSNNSFLHISNKNFFKQANNIKYTKLKKFIKERNAGKIKGNFSNPGDLKNANKSKISWSKKKLIEKIFQSQEFKKKIVVIAAHAFSDAPRNEGLIIFKDYYEHLKETLDYIENKKLKNVFWLVKPHPSSASYNESGIVAKLLRNYKNENIKEAPQNLSAINTNKICDYVVTSCGSISLEFANSGKYPILAGKALYSNLGFTKDHITKNEYFKTLVKIHKIPKLNKKQILTSMKVLFGLESLTTHTVLKNSDIFDNKVFNIMKKNKNNIFSKELIKNLKKIDFIEDKMVKDFLSVKIK